MHNNEYNDNTDKDGYAEEEDGYAGEEDEYAGEEDDNDSEKNGARGAEADEDDSTEDKLLERIVTKKLASKVHFSRPLNSIS